MIISVDTGGTKTLVGSFNTDRLSPKKYRFPTPRNTDDYLAQLSSTLKAEFNLDQAAAISIALPGIVKNDTAVFCPNLLWENFNVVQKLKDILDFKKPIFLENDANLAGLAEAHALNPIPKTALYITISTGIGTGIITEGTIDSSFRLSEGGHMLLEFDGALRVWENFASGQAIYETYGRYAKDITDISTWEIIADKISRGLFAIIPLLHPDTIIFGGSIGTHFKQYTKPLQGIIDERLPHYIDRPLLKEAKHPEEAVIYGCYLYAKQNLA